jgi:hypothetical protein
MLHLVFPNVLVDVEQNGNTGDRLMEVPPTWRKNILFQHKEEFLLKMKVSTINWATYQKKTSLYLFV